MKTILNRVAILAFALTSTLLVSCGDETTNNIYIGDELVKLDAQALITNAQSPFKGKNPAFDNSYVHQMPTSYQAYVVADETRGQYTTGQYLKTITVIDGMNSVSLPKMKVKIYVTNYIKPGANVTANNAWYTWSTAIDQLPQTSQTLNLYGFNSIDYATTTVGNVTMTNPYGAVMIKKNQWVNGVPTSYDTNQAYFLDATTNWYILYIRNNNTNTKIPINIPGNPNQFYDLKEPVTANTINQYTINGAVGDIAGNLGIVVANLIDGIHKQIDL